MRKIITKFDCQHFLNRLLIMLILILIFDRYNLFEGFNWDLLRTHVSYLS